MFNNRNGRTVEAVNRTYHPLGNYADNPEIDLNNLKHAVLQQRMDSPENQATQNYKTIEIQWEEKKECLVVPKIAAKS